MNAPSGDRTALRTTFRESLRSRAISLIGFPAAYSRRIRTTVSTTNIPDPDRLEENPDHRA